ncbi:MAG TPA: alpha/beta hydrolase [Chloroflexota bacterium]|nr:alpha/beta hydrolase [Chloroflexota bacterium]
METGFVQAGSTRLQCFTHGSGDETVVFVHGYSASGRIWRLVQEALNSDRFRSIALSNRGAGDSDRTNREEDYTVDAFARDLFSAVESLGLRNFTLVGHSMGAATVTRFALDHQSLLKALVLLDPAPLDARTRSTPPGGGEPRQLVSDVDDARAPAAFLQALQADIDRNPPERASGGRASMSQLRLRERLSELGMPVLVVGGDRDSLVGVDNILREYLALPTATRSLQIFHGAGHSPNKSVPGGLASVLEVFIGETVPRVAQGRTPGRG